MIHMKSLDIENAECLFGTGKVCVCPKSPYAKEVCDFLDALARALREDAEAKNYPDIQTFAFWIRKANICQLKNSRSDTEMRIGRGLIFHIAPSNVPVNFAYTLVFGLLAGNSNIVRISSVCKKFPQVQVLCRILKQTAQQDSFSWVEQQNSVILYDRMQTDITDFLSKQCDVRVIWGGDETIRQIRNSQLQPRTAEMVFADRYSIAVLSIEKVLEASSRQMQGIADNFYNDTYLMDQNACSSPHLICWYGNKDKAEQAQEYFWEAVYKCASKYELADVKVSEKYALFCKAVVQMHIKKARRFENLLYTLTLDCTPQSIEGLRGKFGMFFECVVEDLYELKYILDDKKVQTCAVYGMNTEELARFVIKNHLQGVDRIVPVGKTLDIGIIWDGYDVIGELSRCMCSG